MSSRDTVSGCWEKDTAFLMAAKRGDVETMERWIHLEINESGRDAFYHSYSNGHLEATRYLLSKGVLLPANILSNLCSRIKHGVFEHANRDDFIRLFIEYGADPFYTNDIWRVPSSYLDNINPEDRERIVDLLENYRVNDIKEPAEE